MDKLVLHECDNSPITLCKQGEYGLVVEYDFGRWVEKWGGVNRLDYPQV